MSSIYKVTPSAPCLKKESCSTCSVCSEERRSVKVLPCGHLFCEYCLQSIINNTTDRVFPCPLCRAMTDIPKWEASGFPFYGISTKNEANAKLVVVVDTAVVNSTVRSKCTTLKACSTCEIDQQQALYYCAQCRTSACEWCQDDHLRENHSLVLIRRQDRTMSAASEVCRPHGGYPMTHKCITCHVPVCQQCLLLPPHRRHKTEELAQAGPKARGNLQKMDQMIQPFLRHLEWVQEDIKDCLEASRHGQQNVEQQIRQRAQVIRDKVNQLEAAALASVRVSGNKVIQQYTDDLQNVDSKLIGIKVKQQHLTSLLEKGSDVKLVEMEFSAIEHVKHTRHLTKFTAGLPRDVFTLRDRSAGGIDNIATKLEKYIGSHSVQQSKRKVPDLN